MVDFYGFHVGKYNISMNSMGRSLQFSTMFSGCLFLISILKQVVGYARQVVSGNPIKGGIGSIFYPPKGKDHKWYILYIPLIYHLYIAIMYCQLGDKKITDPIWNPGSKYNYWIRQRCAEKFVWLYYGDLYNDFYRIGFNKKTIDRKSGSNPKQSMYGIFTYIYHILPLKTTKCR